MNPLNELLDTYVPAEPPDERVWSDYQTAVFDQVRTPDQDILIQAVAGSGKTTTIIKAMDFAQGNSLFMAFNKAIAEDIRQKANSGDVKTLNALGHRMWGENRWRAKLEPKKVPLILEHTLGKDSEVRKEYGWTISRIVGLAKNNALGINEEPSRNEFEELIDSYQLDVPADRISEVAQIALNTFRYSVLDEETFDFDDQLYAPVAQGWEFPSYANTFVDECQDLSPIQHAILSQLKTAGSRLVAVGDRHQAIYGFRGALTDSMDALKRRFEMTELPLSISYRCATRIVEEARRLCPTIEAQPGASPGVVSALDAYEDSDPDLFKDTMVVCRNNAPLFRTILRHVRAKSPCRVLTNFLDSFQSFIRQFKAGTTTQLAARLERWYETESGAARAKGFRGKLAAIEDKYETCKLLCEQYRTVEEIMDLVKQLGSGTAGPTFATIHKAKGLEHDSVFILRPDLIPAFYAQSQEQLQQEDNLLYVAITRAKRSLTYGVRQV